MPMIGSSETSKSEAISEDHGSKQKSSQQIITYLLLVFAFSSVFYFLMLKAHTLGAGGGLYVLGIMWCPALAGMATLKLNGRNLNELGWKWPASSYPVQSLMQSFETTTLRDMAQASARKRKGVPGPRGRARS